jgi:hypothetical protein
MALTDKLIAFKLILPTIQVVSEQQNGLQRSAYDFIHNKRRNRLTPARACDLVFVFTNGRLIEKVSGEETLVGWEEEMEGDAE